MMSTGRKLFAIIGSASANSANLRLVEFIAREVAAELEVEIFEGLKSLPHFDPELSIENTPVEVLKFRNSISSADAVLICTPEYVFSIPSGLKNAIEWCISTTVFSEKPCGLITASASGQKGHEELQLIMRTAMASFSDETTLLINGVRAKIDKDGMITDSNTALQVNRFITAFLELINNKTTSE